MPNYLTRKVEFSVDPLSDTTPSWTDVTQYVQAVEWGGGVTKDTDSPQAGGATITLKNMQRRFEPDYTAGAYYPNIVPGRRFRLTMNGQLQGIYYAREWKVEYPDPSLGYSVVTVACSDGFWRLAQDRTAYMAPPSAESLADVILSDDPFAFYKLDETQGKTLAAAVGPEGTYRGNFSLGAASPVLGDGGTAVTLTDNGYARAKLDDESVWFDAGQMTAECVVTRQNNLTGDFVTGPYDTTAASGSFGLSYFGFYIYNVGAVLRGAGWSGGNLGAGTYHLAVTYDGSKVSGYINGVLDGVDTAAGNIINPDANEFIYVGRAQNHMSTVAGTDTISHAAFYTQALSADRIAAHAAAALSRGYTTQTAGTRIAALSADPLWSTGGIPAGSITNAPTFQHGQPVLDEIVSAHGTELPGSVFYFNDNGDPAYHTLLETWTPAATFGDTPAEIPYDEIDLAYDDDLFNTATVSGPGLAGATATNTQSLSDYGNRGIDQSSLPITSQADANLIAQTYVDRFSTPQFRVESISLNGANASARSQILTREIGDVIRVKRRGEGGVPIDVITRILGKSKSVDVHGDLRCTWSLARGFNASQAFWRVGVAGYSEVGQTTVAG